MELQSVVARLEAISRRLLLLILSSGLSRIILALTGLAAFTFLLDYSLDLPRPVRIVVLLLAAGILAIQAVRHLVLPLSGKPTLDELALMAERADPGLNDQLISAIQLDRDLRAGTAVESPELIRKLVDETARKLERYDFRRAVDLRPARKPLLLALLAVAAASGVAAYRADLADIWFRRQILIQDTAWPRRHHLILMVLDEAKYDPAISEDGRTVTLHVSERTPLQVRVTDARGDLPDEVELVTRFDGDDEPQRIAMGRTQGNDYFQHIFPPLVRSVSFHAVGGDDRDDHPRYVVNVARAPRITRYYAEYAPPPYTGMEPRTLPDANISAPEGTRITMHFEANMPLQTFDLVFDSQGTASLSPAPDGSYRYSFVVENNDFYTYQLRGENGVSSVDGPRYVVTAQTDQPPRVAVDMPRTTSLLLTPRALLPFRGTATDDYGVTSLAIRWGEDPRDLSHGEIPIEGNSLLSPPGSRQIPFFHVLELADLELPARPARADSSAREQGPVQAGDRLALRFLVTDNRSTGAVPEPHRTFGDYEYLVQVLSPEDLEREMGQRQSRLRSRVEEIQHLVEARLLEVDAAAADLRGEDGGDDIQSLLWKLEQDQNRITVELKASSRQFITAYDSYLWNRVEEGALTNNMILNLSRSWRAGRTDDPFRIYGEAVAAVRPLVNETEMMGRLTAILDIFLATAAELSPEVQRQISRAALMTSRDDRLDRVLESRELMRRLRDALILLKTKLEAWEDYLDVVQKLRNLLDQQKGIRERIEDLTNRK